MVKTKTKTVKDVIIITTKMGDKLNAVFNQTDDIKVATTSLNAYRTAIQASKAQIIYKKLTGRPSVIDFLED